MPKKQRNNLKQKFNVEPVLAKGVEVTLEECGGDYRRMIKKFVKQCRKEEVLKPYFDRMYFKSKGQKRREKHLRAVYEQKKEQSNK